MEQISEQSGFKDVLVGAELFRHLNIGTAEFNNPSKMGQIKEIAEFLNDHPDPYFIIGMTRNNKSPNMDNLEFLAGMVRLEKNRTTILKQLEETDKQLKHYKG